MFICNEFIKLTPIFINLFCCPNLEYFANQYKYIVDNYYGKVDEKKLIIKGLEKFGSYSFYVSDDLYKNGIFDDNDKEIDNE